MVDVNNCMHACVLVCTTKYTIPHSSHSSSFQVLNSYPPPPPSYYPPCSSQGNLSIFLDWSSDQVPERLRRWQRVQQELAANKQPYDQLWNEVVAAMPPPESSNGPMWDSDSGEEDGG